jgi:hypothetical protein
MMNNNGADSFNMQNFKGDTYKKYVEVAETTEAHNVPVTAENIHEVKVALMMNSTKNTNEDKQWTSWAFKILFPHVIMPLHMDRHSAKTFFDDIKAKRNLQPGELQLSWWFIKEVEKDYQEKFIAGGASDGSFSNKHSS